MFGELLVGDTGGRRPLLRDYERLTAAPLVAHDEVAAFVRARALAGRGLGWIDVHLLAAALVGRRPLWSADGAVVAAAAELAVAY